MVTLMGRHFYNNVTKPVVVLQMIMSPIRECGYLLCYKPGYAVEQTVKWMGLYNVLMLILHHCNNNAIKRNLDITND